MKRKIPKASLLLAAVVANSNDAITVQDLDGRILAWNLGAERIYGYSEAEALNMNILAIIPKNRQKEASDFLQQLKSGEVVESFESQRVAKDGRILDVWLTVTKLVDDSGNVISISTTERDITEKKQMQVKMEQTIADLQKALAGVKTLTGFLPICASCKNVRDDKGYWKQIETYIRDHTEVEFSHGICPDCAKKLYPDLVGENGIPKK